MRTNFYVKDRKKLSLFLFLIIICVFTLTIAYSALNAILTIQGNGYLTPTAEEEVDPTVMTWEVVKVYTMPDGQKGVKIMRIA